MIESHRQEEYYPGSILGIRPKYKHLTFAVNGVAIPKQSFRAGSHNNYQPVRLRSWQDWISAHAVDAIAGRRSEFPFSEPCQVAIHFYLPNKRKKDIDNLSKAVLDGCKHIIFKDDEQVWDLHIRKLVDPNDPRVEISIEW